MIRQIPDQKFSDTGEGKQVQQFHENVTLAMRDVQSEVSKMKSDFEVTDIGNVDDAFSSNSVNGFVQYTKSGTQYLGVMINGSLYRIGSLSLEG